MKTAGLFRYQELALGEYTMPVLGMLSVFDWSEMGDKEKTWSGCDPSAVPPCRTPVPCPRAAMHFCMIWDLGREWFVVKKAEVRMAEDQTLIPHVRMGVEATNLGFSFQFCPTRMCDAKMRLGLCPVGS